MTLSPDDRMEPFAAEVTRFLVEEGERRQVVYDPTRNRLTVGDFRTLTHFVSLKSLKARYDSIDGPTRIRVLERDLIAMRWGQPTPEALKRRLYPRLRPLAAFDSLELKRKVIEHLNPIRASDLSVPRREFNSTFGVHLVFQLSEEAVDVGQDRLDSWKQNFEDLLKLGLEHLLEQPKEPLREVRPNLWALTGGNGHIASRILFDESWDALPFKEDAVAIIPNHNLILFARKDDDEALSTAAHFALDATQGPLGLWALALARKDGKWEPWMPAPERSCYEPLKLAALPGTVKLYANHKDFLAAWLEIQKLPVEVSPLLAMQPENNVVFTTAVWRRGTTALIPVADKLAVVDTENGETHAWSVPWEQIKELGLTFERAEGRLEYWQVSGDVPLERFKQFPQVE